MDIRSGIVRRNKRKREKALEEEREGCLHETEAESSESEAKAMIIKNIPDRRKATAKTTPKRRDWAQNRTHEKKRVPERRS